MKRKRVVVMGFMGSIPIAGVIWQHIHYIIGLQRLGHDVYYIEDSARLPYNAQTFDTSNDYSYAAKVLAQLANEFGFERRWAFCARYLPEKPTAGLRLRKIQQLYIEADAILNVCGTQEFNDDLLRSDSILYIESDPGVEQIKVDKGNRSTAEYLGKHRALFTFGENIGSKRFPVPLTQTEVVADPAADRDRFLEDESRAWSRRRLYLDRKLVHQRFERHRVARRKISLEQVARIPSFRCGAEEIRRAIRTRDRHQGRENAEKIPHERLALLQPPPK